MIDARTLVLLLTCACTPTRVHAPVVVAPASTVTAPPREEEPSPGRLRTGPGLCGITGQEEGENPGRVALVLRYDERGRPVRAEADVSPAASACVLPSQTHVVTWSWDAADRLVQIEHTVAYGPEAERTEDLPPCDPQPETACLHEGETLLVERSTWRYATDGSLAAWTETYADCSASERTTETLRREGDVVVVMRDEGPERHRLDDAGRVVEVTGRMRHAYDEAGRLVETTTATGSVRRVSYTAPAVGAPVLPDRPNAWTQTQRDGRIDLVGAPPRRATVHLDAQGRPVAVDGAISRWAFEYGGCEHADEATHYWWLDRLLDEWPWPEEPTAGAGEASRRAWLHESLPLSSL